MINATTKAQQKGDWDKCAAPKYLISRNQYIMFTVNDNKKILSDYIKKRQKFKGEYQLVLH